MSRVVDTDSIMGALREYFMKCPHLQDGVFNVDFLPSDRSYSIAALPADPVYKRYVDGGKIYQLMYSFTSKEAYDGDVRTMIDNSLFYERLANWVEEQDSIGNLPVIPNHNVLSNELITSGYLFDADGDLAQYQIQMRLLYM